MGGRFRLLTGEPQQIPSGLYRVKMVMTTGDARLQDSVQGEDMEDIPDTIQTSTTSFNIHMASVNIQSLITGDAVVYLNLISRNP